MRSGGSESLLTTEFLEKLVSGLGKAKSIDRLHQMEKRVGKHPAIDALIARLEDKLRMNCPRCSIELQRPEMMRHLWEEHRLVLDGRRVRDPWALIEEWLDAFHERPEAQWLERCRVAGPRIDPENGLLRVQRLLQMRGINDPEVRRALLDEAKEQHAARCPRCFALTPMPREAPPLNLIERPGRLSAHGYSVEISERGLRTYLEVRTPNRLIYQGREKKRYLTVRGASVLLVTPVLILALAFAIGALDIGIGPLIPTLVLLAAAIGAHFLARKYWRPRLPLAERIRNCTWAMLVPKLHAEGFSLEDSAFIAGLAQRNPERRQAALRAALVPALVKHTENAVLSSQAPPGHLAALRRALIEDAAAAGEDPVPLVVEQLARCFEGRLPLAFADHLFEDWRSDVWTRGNLARLRILLCDRAFEAGFEVRNVLDAGENAPSLGSALGVDKPDQLASLRLLWSFRASQPWFRCGIVQTAFTLAADPDRARLLGQYPDLILWQEEKDWNVAVGGGKGKLTPLQILLCTRGVVIQDVLFREAPREIEVFSRSQVGEVLMSNERFRAQGDLDDLVRHVERWFRYGFNDFLPQLEKVQEWQPHDRAAVLRAWGAVPCPDCGRYLLARVGEFGLAPGDR
jgi:hypothetical protein